jgi:flagellar basal-body rod protein FlgB
MASDETTISALSMALKYRELKNKIISSNIANAETPGYKSKKIDFEDALGRAIDVENQRGMVQGNDGHYAVGGGGLEHMTPEVYDDPSGVVSDDGNTVDRDDEMSKLAENRYLYEASIQLLNKKLGQMKYVLSSER